MNEQPAAGWYPDADGIERFWDGTAWTDQVHALALPAAAKKSGAFSKLGAAVKNAAAEKKAAKEELARQQAADAAAAGPLVTGGVFGTSTVEIYENGYVRVASWPAGAAGAGPKTIDKNTPYERLRSIRFTQPESEASAGSSTLEGTVGPAVAKLLKGGKGLMKASAPGMAVAGIAHVASNAARKSFLTIATDKAIHSLTNQTANSVGLKMSNKGHNEIGRALEAAGIAVLAEAQPAPAVDAPAVPAPQPAGPAQSGTPSTLSERLRELADLHKDGILSDDEFASAKAKLLNGL
jgi:hypothetical protein